MEIYSITSDALHLNSFSCPKLSVWWDVYIDKMSWRDTTNIDMTHSVMIVNVMAVGIYRWYEYVWQNEEI